MLSMNAIKRFSITLVSALLLSSMAMTLPVSAHTGSDDSNSSSGSNNHDEHSTVSGPVTPIKEVEPTEHQTEVENHASSLRDQFQSLAQQDLAEKRSQVQQHTEAERQKACDTRKDNLSNRMDNFVKEAQNHKAVFDKIYVKVKAFHDSKGLSVADYDALVTAADKAQSDTAASITALQGLNVPVDCTSQTVVDNVSAFQQAVKATRDSLKTYRSSIVDLISAVKAAHPSSTEGGSQ
jgi:hypothetical protein